MTEGDPGYREAMLRTTDEADVVSYRAVSKVAVVSALIGAFSFLALMHPILVLLPLTAVVLAVVALRAIRVSTAGLTGRALAVVGLALGALFLSAAATRTVSRDWIMTRRGRQFAADWLQLVAADEREKAYEMTLTPERRQLPGADLRKFYSDDAERFEQLQQFFDDSPLEVIVEHGRDGQFRLREILDSGHASDYGDYVSAMFSFDYSDGQRRVSQPVHIVVRRLLHRRTGRGQWFVEHVGDVEDPEED
jgi:hypothetical protein